MKVGWYYHRLRAMTVSELAHRVAERWKHRSDASFAAGMRGIELGESAQGVIVLPDREAAPEALQQRLALDAASILRGDWKLFGWREANVGTPPRWHRDAACGVDLAPDVLAHRLNHRSLPAGADARTVWEINRWSEMVRLAMHGHVSNDLEPVRTAVAWLEDWCDKNPVGHGINWTSPLEAGLRLVNFVWFDALVDELECRLQPVSSEPVRLKPALQRLAERIVPAHAAWVWRYRSFGSSANNHLLGELVGLLHAVKRWPALERVICPAEQLWQEISACVLEQFAEDGGNKEQALHYHLFAWEMAWHAARLMRVTDGPVIERLNKAAEFFVHVAHDSEQWEYGDNDDAQIVPVTLEREQAVAEWKAWMGGTGCQPVSATGSLPVRGCSIDFWLGRHPSSLDCGQAARNTHRLAACATSGWWSASESGMATCEHDGWKIRLDASPLGYGAMAAHGHGDALHISLWDGQKAIAIDPGTGGYYSMKEQRTALAEWGAHNGPQPTTGFRTPARMGTFLWSDHHAPPSLEKEGRSAIRAHFEHEDCKMTRFVEFDENGEVVVRDDLWGKCAFRVCWHLAPSCEVAAVSPHLFLVKREGVAWEMEVQGPGLSSKIKEGIASQRYGHFSPCVVIEVLLEQGTVTTRWRRKS